MKRLLSTFAVLALVATTATTSTAWIKHNQQFHATDPKTAQNETAQDIANKLTGKTVNLQFNNWVGQKIADNISLFQNALVNQGLLTQDEARYVYNNNVTWRVQKQQKAPGCVFSVQKDGQTASASDITLNIYTGYKIWNFNNVLYANVPGKGLLISTDGGQTWTQKYMPGFAGVAGQVDWMQVVHGLLFFQYTFAINTDIQHQSSLWCIYPYDPTQIKIIDVDLKTEPNPYVRAGNFLVTYSGYNQLYYIYLDFPGNTTTYHIISTANPINQPWEVDFNGSGARGGTPDDNYINQMVAAKNVNPVSDFSELLYFSSVPNSTSGGYVNVYNIRTNYWYRMAGAANVKNLGFLSSNDIFEETSKFGLWQMQYPSTPSTAFNRQWSVNATAINQVTAFNKGYYVATTNGLYYWYPTLIGWKEFQTFTGEPYVVDWMQNINNTLYVDIPNLGVLKSYMTPSGKTGFSPMASLSSPGLTVSSIQERLGVIYAFTNKGVYQSFDNGLTFQKNQDLANVNIPAPNQNSIASEGNNVAIVANGYAYQSTDGGLTFTATKL